MGNSLGNASLILGATASKLLGGLKDAAAGIKSFSDKTQTGLASAFTGATTKISKTLSNMKGILSGAGGAIGTALGGPLGAAVGSAVGAGAGDIVETLFASITKPFDKIKEFGQINKQAGVLGIQPSDLQGLNMLLAKCGIEAENTGHVFAIMGKNIAHSIDATGDKATAFKNLGIVPEEIKNASYTDQFRIIADAISKLPPGAQQAQAAISLMGKTGDSLLPILQKGAKGIDEFIAKAKKTGVVLSNSDLKSAGEAAKAWKESKEAISHTWEGLMNRATIIAAPVIKFWSGMIQKAFTIITPIFEWVGRAVSKVSKIISAVFEVISGWVDEAITWVSDLVKSITGLGSNWMSIEDVITKVFKTIGQAAGNVWDAIRAGVGAGAYVTSYLVSAFGKLVDTFKGTVKNLLDIAGKLPDSLGGKMFRDASKGVDTFGDRTKKAAEDMRKWGAGQIGQFGSSATRIGKWFDNLKDKTDEAAKSIAKVKEETAPEYKGIAANLRGSKEAYSIESKFRYDSANGLNGGKKIEEKNNDELKKVNQKLDKVAGALGAAVMLQEG